MLLSQVMLIDKKKEQKESVFLHFCTLVCSFASTLYIAGVTALLLPHCPSPFVCPKVSHPHVLLCPVLMDLPSLTRGCEAVCPSTSRGTAGVAGAGGSWGGNAVIAQRQEVGRGKLLAVPGMPQPP